MEIILKNIGLIRDATVALDGLTVITGDNNSGKTTVGKTLFALVDAVSNIHSKAEQEKLNYANDRMHELNIRYSLARQESFVSSGNEFLMEFSSMPFRMVRGKDVGATSSYIRELSEALKSLRVLHSAPADSDDGSQRHRMSFSAEDRDSLVSDLEAIIEVLESDPELLEYTKKSIGRALSSEFHGQIGPVRHPGLSSSIVLRNGSGQCFTLEIENNSIVNGAEDVFTRSPYDNVLLIDNPFVLSDIDYYTARTPNRFQDDSWFYEETKHNHNTRLASAIKAAFNPPSIIEESALEKKLEPLKQKIDAVVPGRFVSDSNGQFYVKDNFRLDTANLATGSKMFSIIKLLLNSGAIGEQTLLILDEPESHLHPSWQAVFAEVIVLMVKHLGVTVLLTTHSSNFTLAIDAFMREHDIIKHCNFYMTRILDDGYSVTYANVNEDIGAIYDSFVESMIDMKVRRDAFL